MNENTGKNLKLPVGKATQSAHLGLLYNLMADQPRKKGRVENRPVTASARATRATKRSIQDSQQNINKSALVVNENFKQSHKSLDDQPDDNELEQG
ncbi:hypothetical protein RDABS01_035141 [Bienertia sinuspersici]